MSGAVQPRQRTFRVIRGPDDPAPLPPDRLLTVREVAKVLRIGKTKAYEMAAQGLLPVVRLPGTDLVRISERALERWITDRTVSAS